MKTRATIALLGFLATIILVFLDTSVEITWMTIAIPILTLITIWAAVSFGIIVRREYRYLKEQKYRL